MLSILTCVLIFGLGSSGCRARGSGQEKRYDLKGKIVSVDEKAKQLIIAHEAIPDLMEAMTMPFNVKEEWVYRELQPGDGIQATLVVEGDRSWLENIIATRQSADPSASIQPGSVVEPNPGDEVPDFTLVNQDGKPISLHQYRGRALVLTFIYTRCPLPDFCPLMTENFAAIERALQKQPDLYAKTHLLSISVDPEYDTPKVLREYGAEYAKKDGRPAFAHWEFASGSNEQVKNVATFFGLQYGWDGEQIIHSLSTAVIAPDGKLLKLYRRNQWKPDEIVSDLQSFKHSD